VAIGVHVPVGATDDATDPLSIAPKTGVIEVRGVLACVTVGVARVFVTNKMLRQQQPHTIEATENKSSLSRILQL